jgi:hypothetical protein
MYRSSISAEKLDNYSICVLTKVGVRKMQYQEDIEDNLVYVCNIPKTSDNDESFIITQGECVRYVPIVVSPKFNMYL